MIDPEPQQVEVQPVGGVPRRVFAAILFVLLVIAVAIVKPWNSAQVGPAPAPTNLLALVPATAAASASPLEGTPAPTMDAGLAEARLRTQCGSAADWHLLTMETDPLGDARTLYGQTPVQAAGPDDPTIPSVDLTAIRLYGIGACRPGYLEATDEGVPVTGVSIWQLGANGQAAMIGDLSVIDTDLSRVGEAYFAPPRPAADPLSPPGQAPAWGPGHYVVEVAATAGRPTLWFGLAFTSVDSRSALVNR